MGRRRPKPPAPVYQRPPIQLAASVAGLLSIAGALASSSGGGGSEIPPPPTGSRPFIWLDTSVLARVTAKKNANDADWLSVKSDADYYAGRPAPSFTITNITNAEPAVATIAETVPWTDREDVYIGGATGAWTPVNHSGYPPVFGYKTGANTFAMYATAVNVHFGSSSSPVEFTLWEDVPWASGTHAIKIVGLQNGWESLNGDWTATKTGQFTFTVPASSIGLPDFHSDYFAYVTYGGTLLLPLNATSFGSFSGQSLTMFPYNYVDYSYQGDGWWQKLVRLALCYKILGNSPTAYGTKAVQWLDYIVSLGVAGIKQPVSADSYYATRFTLSACAVVFDWCYPLLTPTQKTRFATALNFWYDQTVANALDWNGPLASNYFTGHIWGVGSAALACIGDNSRAGEIIAAVRTQINNLLVPGFAVGGDYEGGYPFESYGYGTNSYERFLYYLDALRTTTGESLQAQCASLADSLIYNLRPDNWRAGDEGDYPGSFVGVLIPTYPITLTRALSGTPRADWMQYLYRQLPTVPGQGDATLARLFWYDSALGGTNYTSTEPTGKYSPGDCRLFKRSNWTTSAVWMGFNGASNSGIAGHQAHSSGHIGVQRGDDNLMPYAGQWKGVTGVYQTAPGQVETFQRDSTYASVLYHNDGGVYNYTGIPYNGGQGAWGINQMDGHQVDAAHDFGYAQADLTPAYYNQTGPTGRTLTTYKRAVVFAGSGVAIVFDYALRASSSYVGRLQWHVNQSATVTNTGGTVTAALGASKLFLRPLLPASAGIAVNRDFTSPDDSGTPTCYRVEVSNGAPSTLLRALHAMYVGASSLSAMPTTTLITASGSTAFGCSIVDGALTWVAMFAADGAAQDDISYTAT